MDPDQFDSSCPVFKDPEVAQRFVSFINDGSGAPVAEEDIWKWMRVPPLETIVRNEILHSYRADLGREGF